MLRPMIDARHRWVFPDPIRLDPEFRAAARDPGLGTFAAAVLARRGVDDVALLTGFLGPALAGLNDPHLLPDADRAGRAGGPGTRARGARHGLRGLRCGRPVRPGAAGPRAPPPRPRRDPVRAVASRGGPRDLDRPVAAAAEAGVTLIMTVDTGSTSVAEVAAAAERGIDVLITDHHHLPEVLPAAVALVNPHRADSVVPGPRALGVRRRVHRRAPAPGGPHRRRVGRARPGRPRHHRDRLGRRADPGREPGDRPPGPRPDALGARGPGSPPSWRGPGSHRRRSTWRRSASCLRRGSTPPGGWGRRSTPHACCWPRRRRRPRPCRRLSRPPTRRGGT